VLWWAARSDRPWLVPAACIRPAVIWLNGLSMLIGSVAIWADRQNRAPAETISR
jgi:hypothetical protein